MLNYRRVNFGYVQGFTGGQFCIEETILWMEETPSPELPQIKQSHRYLATTVTAPLFNVGFGWFWGVLK